MALMVDLNYWQVIIVANLAKHQCSQISGVAYLTDIVHAVCKGKAVGFGWRSYELGLRGLVDIIKV